MVFQEKMIELMSGFSVIANMDLSFEEKIRAFVKKEIEVIGAIPTLPLFVLTEMNRDPDLFLQKLQNAPIGMIFGFIKKQFQDEIDAGRFRNIPFEQFLINMVSLCIYPFIGKPMFKFVLRKDEKEYQEMMEVRKVEVAEFLIESIRVKK